ncbi:MAG: hypothetical protein K2M43_00275, partial [Mycoplasmoidaceae bacterium]|nr:hypothetical protein [Mycoplasmoidaceae bacterium]
MPETIKNTCDSKYNDLINKVGSRIFSDHALENYEKFFIDTENSDETHNYSINQSNILDFTGTGLN